MWLLNFFCIAAVAGAPFSPLGNTKASSSGNVSAAVENPTGKPVGAVSLNDTHNGTSPAAGAAPSDPAHNSSAETSGEDILSVLEGDILLVVKKGNFFRTEEEDEELEEDRDAVQTVWRDAVVFYAISDELADRKDEILAAFKMISDATCVRFKKHGGELNYIEIRSGKRCASLIGCRGGAQPVLFGPACSSGNLCHELMHTLGLYHEHTRQDRDQHVTIHWDNIQPGKQGNFAVKNRNTLDLPYDLGSIMHYGKYYFSTNGNSTMVARQGGKEMGQRSHLSQLDVQRVNRLYHCGNKHLTNTWGPKHPDTWKNQSTPERKTS